MSDIVERLRSFKENVSNDMIELLETPEVCTEAADEIERLRAERDEADRRAGAAERHNAELKKDASARQSWLSKAKKEWGVDDVVSFDVVWAEALTLRAELAAAKETQRRFAASYSRLGVEARDAEIERLRAEASKWQALSEATTQVAEACQHRCERLRTDLAAKQARIDALMLEHCPGEMTPEQLETWGEHQRAVDGSAGCGLRP